MFGEQGRIVVSTQDESTLEDIQKFQPSKQPEGVVLDVVYAAREVGQKAMKLQAATLAALWRLTCAGCGHIGSYRSVPLFSYHKHEITIQHQEKYQLATRYWHARACNPTWPALVSMNQRAHMSRAGDPDSGSVGRTRRFCLD